MAKVNDVVNKFVEEVIAISERDGILPWNRPWSGGSVLNSPSWNRRNVKADGTITQRYSIFNSLLLGIGYDTETKKLEYDCLEGEWATFNDIKAEGGKVTKGSKGRHVVFFSFVDTKDKDGNIMVDEDGVIKQHAMLRYYTVFHIETMTDLEPKGNAETVSRAKIDTIEELENIIDNYVKSCKTLAFCQRYGSNAYYSPSSDTVVVPTIDQFNDISEYYSTTFHELVHSTGHKSRLNRGLEKPTKFGSEDYSREELVAEIGNATIMSLTSFETKDTRINSVAYVQSWLKALKEDTNMLMWASNRADKAVNMILGA